jgi:hypothetical protein
MGRHLGTGRAYTFAKRVGEGKKRTLMLMVAESEAQGKKRFIKEAV